MPIRIRLAMAFAAGTALLIGVGGFVFVSELAGGLRNSVAVGLAARNQAVAQAVAGGAADIPGNAKPEPASAGEQDDAVQIIGPRGQVLSATGFGQRAVLLDRAQLAGARKGRVLADVRTSATDAPVMVLAAPAGRTGLVVVTGATLDTVDQAVRRVVLALVIGGPLGVLAAGAAAWFVAGAALRPVERMRRQAADISAHDTDAALDVPSTRDEIARLSHTLNELLARLQGALDRQRGFVAAAGHELRTPLTNLKIELELAARPSRTRRDLAAAVAGAAGEVERLSRLAEDLLLLARSDANAPVAELSPQDVRVVVTAAVDSAAGEAARRGVSVELAAETVTAPIDAARYRQIVDNLLDNALRFSPAGTAVSVCLRRSEAGDLVLDVLDRGPGFPAPFLARAFDRFSRPDGGRDRQHGGAGLGLAIVKALAEAHGGRVEAVNRQSGGALVRVTTPGADSPTGPATTEPPGGAGLGGRAAPTTADHPLSGVGAGEAKE